MIDTIGPYVLSYFLYCIINPNALRMRPLVCDQIWVQLIFDYLVSRSQNIKANGVQAVTFGGSFECSRGIACCYWTDRRCCNGNTNKQQRWGQESIFIGNRPSNTGGRQSIPKSIDGLTHEATFGLAFNLQSTSVVIRRKRLRHSQNTFDLEGATPC